MNMRDGLWTDPVAKMQCPQLTAEMIIIILQGRNCTPQFSVITFWHGINDTYIISKRSLSFDLLHLIENQFRKDTYITQHSFL